MYRLFLALLMLFLSLGSARALTPNQAVAAALSDLDAIAKEDQTFTRYLFLPPDATNYDSFVLALKLHVNLISREATLAYPHLVAEGVFRVDLREYQWNPKVWEKLADVDPYFHRLDSKEIVEHEDVYENVYRWWPGGVWSGDNCYYPANSFQYYTREKRQKEIRKKVVKRDLYVPQGAGQLASLALLTESNAPIVRADWFLAQGARQTSLDNEEDTGVGYYDWLELASLKDYLRLIGEDEKTFLRIEQELRSVVGESGVAQGNRQIVQTGAQAGKHWTTLEVKKQKARGIAIQNLRRGEFDFAAQEHYAPLPNTLPVTFLNDAKGVRQSSVPDFIAGDNSPLNRSRDLRVHINLACMRCHEGRVLQPIEDDVRPVYTGRLLTVTNDKGVALELKRQYGSNLDKALQLDRSLYQDAFTLVTGKKPQEAAALYSDAFSRYAYSRVTAEMAAAEMGVTVGQLRKALRDAATRLGRGDFRTDPFIAPIIRTIPRENWEDAFQDTQDILYGILKTDDPLNQPKGRP